MNTIRVVLVDDHLIVREGIGMIIANDREIDLVGEAENITDTLALVAHEKPDVILLDLNLGKESAVDSIQEILFASEDSRILVLTGIVDEKLHKSAMQNGAQGIILKNQAGVTLLKAIKRIHQGEIWLDRALTAKLLTEANKKNLLRYEQLKKINTLTVREREIIKLVAEGMVNKEIARRLFVNDKTIRNHLTIIYSKLVLSNRLELAIYASHNELDI
ncbi:MAG TPA: response regulator transcription factor [Pyrinomonadaceae bacterium]